MVFSSLVFLFCFLPVFFFLYYIADRKYKNGVILAGSIFFYAWGAPRFICVILATTIIDFYVVRAMDASTRDGRRKLLLLLSLCINLGLLFYFKYANFLVENVNHLLGKLHLHEWRLLKVVLPIGISFYTFETITYVVDVYRKVHKPVKSFLDYQLYIILFPKLIAGPIIPFHDIADQINDHVEHETAENRLRGFYRFCIGLGKKVLIANILGSAASDIFAATGHIGTGTAWMGALCYTFQIYFDFSGYSDMAIGLALMMGFRFAENFNNPYTALSITDFWRKWHISLGNWMRNYLYIPLGGNRVSKRRLFFNLWLVFLLSGLWHGAAWGFIFWGAYHGFFLVIERLFLGKWLARLGKLAFIYTFGVVLVGWVFFKCEYMHPSLQYLHEMFSQHAQTAALKRDPALPFTLGVAVFFSFFVLLPWGRKIQQKIFFEPYPMWRHYVMSLVAIVLLFLSAGHITLSTFNPFIYFRF